MFHSTRMALPHYYTGLSEFRGVFNSGTPILTYHKLGHRPPGVRMKGMYLSAQLFNRHLQELRQDGWHSGSLEDIDAQPRSKRIVITFDDGYVNALHHGLPALTHAGLTAIQFLVADFIGRNNEWDVAHGEHPEPLMDAAQVRDWLAAGQRVGAHTCTHAMLTQVPLALAREEIYAGKKKLEDLFTIPVEHFCYPYGQWNEPVRDLVIEAGYKTACTTQTGMNAPGESPFTLKRFTARYRSRNLKNLVAAILKIFPTRARA